MCSNFIGMSVIIGSFNTLSKLKLVLDSFSKQEINMKSFEVIVVDSSSSDGTAKWLQKAKFPFQFRSISQPNRGKAAARNTGIYQSNAKIILITDADMIAHPQLIQRHLELHQKYPKGIIIEGKTFILRKEQLPVETVLKRPYINRKIKNEQKLDFYDCLSGNLSIPKHFFQQGGYFDEQFQHYGWEDIDLGYRFIRKYHFPIIFAEKAINYHYHVWTNYDEILRREKMGKSVNILIKKTPQLASFLGINAANSAIFHILEHFPLLTEQWLTKIRNEPEDQQKQGSRLTRFRNWALRELYYQKGYRKNYIKPVS